MHRVEELDLSFPKLTEEQRLKMIASNKENRERARAAAARHYKKEVENAQKEEQVKKNKGNASINIYRNLVDVTRLPN